MTRIHRRRIMYTIMHFYRLHRAAWNCAEALRGTGAPGVTAKALCPVDCIAKYE